MARLRRNLIDELELAISSKDIGGRAAALRRVTNLFVATSGQLSSEQIELFDHVMGCLLEEIETSARAAFSHIMATASDAPFRIIRTLALDDTIDVAGPVLAHSERVDHETLAEGARTKSQAHLLAISRRRTLSEELTDILVDRGDREVALSTAGNPGAAFSEFGYSTLVRRSAADDELAVCVGLHPKIPRQHLLKLLADASESVKLRLTSEAPRSARLIPEVIAQAAQQIRTRTRERSAGFAAAQAAAQSLHEAGALGESQLAQFARAAKFDETAVALSLICDLPIATVEEALVADSSEQIVVIAKAAGLSWETVKPILLLQAQTQNGGTPRLDRAFETFTRLKAETAKKAMQFYRLRQRAAMPGATQ